LLKFYAEFLVSLSVNYMISFVLFEYFVLNWYLIFFTINIKITQFTLYMWKNKNSVLKKKF